MAKDWIKKAVNPKHKGYCTPMTKSTCTPRRKAFAKTMKKHHGFHKMEDGGLIAYNPNLAANDVAFQKWYSKNTLEGQNNRPYTDKMDYDYYSFFRNNGVGSIENHFPDSYKRPSHKTFSNESIYSTPENPGGSWKGDTFIPPSKSTRMKKTYIPKAALGMQITQAGANAATAGARQAAAYVNPNVKAGGLGDIDYSGILDMLSPAFQSNTDTRIQPGQQQVQEGASTGSMVGGSAAKGAALGTKILPGWGTAIGAVVGAGAGLLGASKERKRERKELNQIEAVNRDKYQNLDIDPNFDPYGEQSTFYMEDGGMVHNMGGPQEEQQQQEQMKIVDIEKGELLVNPLTFEILREYTNPNKYSPHASNPQKEPIGNFTAISPGHMVIPKKLATKYKAGDTLSKKSIIMQIIKNQRNEPPEVIESPMGEVEEYGKGGVGCGGGSRMRDYAYGGYVEDAETIPVEVEGGEVYETPGGKVKKVKGPSHEKGGVAKVLPAGTKIYSDRLGLQSDTMADRKLKREKTIDTIQGKLRKPTTDSMVAGLQTTLAKKTLEDENDMREQEFIQYALQQQKLNAGKKPVPGGPVAGMGGGGGLAQIINAYGTGPGGLKYPGDDPWNTTGYNPEDAFSNRTMNLLDDTALDPGTYSQMNIAQKYGARPLPGGRVTRGTVDPYAVSAGRDRTMMSPYPTGVAKPDLGAMLRTNKLPYGVTSSANYNAADDAPAPAGDNKFGINNVNVSRALNFLPTAFGAGIAARYEPEIYDENTQIGRAKNLISEMETNPSIEASRNAIRTAGANRNALLNNLNSPSTRAEAASTYGDVLNAEGQLIQNATNTAMDARNKKRGALAEMEAKQGDARLNAREKLRVNMQMNRANSNKMIQSALSELSQNYGAQVRDDSELNSINQILDYAKINNNGTLEDTKAFGAAVMDLMKSGKGVTVENLQDAYATSGMGYSKGRSNTRNTTNRNVRAGIRSLLTPKKKG